MTVSPNDCVLIIRIVTITANDSVEVAHNTTIATFDNCIIDSYEYNCLKVMNCDVGGAVRVY